MSIKNSGSDVFYKIYAKHADELTLVDQRLIYFKVGQRSLFTISTYQTFVTYFSQFLGFNTIHTHTASCAKDNRPLSVAGERFAKSIRYYGSFKKDYRLLKDLLLCV